VSVLTRKGIFYGVGVGPGDPELITLKAARLIRSCEVVTYIGNIQGCSIARKIAREMLSDRAGKGLDEHPILMPMCDNRDTANWIYDQASAELSVYLDQGKDIVFLCEGDPFFFGSFTYLYDRLHTQYVVEVIPGVNSINAASAAVGKNLGKMAESVVIVSGRRSDEDILNILNTFDNIAIIKSGRRRWELLALIRQAGRIEEGCYVEYVGHEKQQVIVRDLTQLDEQPGPYFSLFLINRSQKSPTVKDYVKATTNSNI